jgi:glycosyltransferase involved in cell wall biosynthesis/SAM-dependent methyltransferase
LRLVALSWRDLANSSAGGAEILIDKLLTGLASRGHDVALLCGGPVAEHGYEAIIAMTRFRDADVIIDVENGLPYFSPLWRRRPSLCLVHHVHTDQWHDRFPHPVASTCQAIERRVMPAIYRNRMFIAVSNSTAKDLMAIGVPEHHICVIESGVDVPAGPAAETSSQPLFISLNRLVPHKRVELLLDAWALAAPDIAGRLIVAGDGPELGALRKKASTIPRVDVVGRVSEETKQRLLAEAWGIVSTAHHEGWGMSIMEAAAVGTPALALDAPGIRDAVVDDVTGVLVRAPHHVQASALAAAWVTLAADRTRRERLGAAAQQRASHYSWEKTIDRWETVLEEVAAARTDLGPRRGGVTAAVATTAMVLASTAKSPIRNGAKEARPSFLSTCGLSRSVKLLKGFRTQYEDPDGFYTLLANDTVDLVGEYEPVLGQRIIDVGGGPGYFAQAFRRAGAESVFVEPFWDPMTDQGRSLGYGVLGDGLCLPFADATFDISHSSNVIEHVAEPHTFLDEMIRVVRPGGLVFLAFTNWFSPFGGHETSPWHYLGGERAAQRYERRHGHPAKNRFGEGLFPLHIGQVLRWAKVCDTADVIDTFPRYYPHWTRSLIKVPGLREVASWNLTLVMRRRPHQGS